MSAPNDSAPDSQHRFTPRKYDCGYHVLISVISRTRGSGLNLIFHLTFNVPRRCHKQVGAFGKSTLFILVNLSGRVE